MIVILKPSKLSFTLTCTNYDCQCVFCCDVSDFHTRDKITFVKCPVCKKENRIIIEVTKND